MRISDALRNPGGPEPTVEERLDYLEAKVVGMQAALGAALSTLVYGDPDMFEMIRDQMHEGLDQRREDDAAGNT